MISVVIPVFNEENNVLPVCMELKDVLDKQPQDYEIIFVDDGSTDETGTRLQKQVSEMSNLRVVQLSNRFGKSAALTAGFDNCRGDIIVTLDGDGQDDPKNIPLLLAKMNGNIDVVCGWRFDRKDSTIKKINSKIYNILNRIFSKVRIHDNNCTLRVYRKEAVTNLSLIKGAHRYLPAILTSRGFKLSEIEISHRPRLSGKSKYGAKRLFKGLVDLFKFNLFLKNKYIKKSTNQTLYDIKAKYGFEI